MKRIVLVLGLAAAAWLGRRQLRSAADAQRYLTLLALLQVVAVMGKTSASPKAYNVEKRLNEQVMPALGAVGPIGAAGNASFLATLIQQSSPSNYGDISGDSFSSGFGGGVWTSGQQSTLVAWLAQYNALVVDANALGARVNQIYSLLRAGHEWS